MHDPPELMQLAIDKAREGMAAGQTPFGCAIANHRRVIAVAHNTVLGSVDIYWRCWKRVIYPQQSI